MVAREKRGPPMTLANMRSRMLPATDRRLRPSPANLSPRPKSLLHLATWLGALSVSHIETMKTGVCADECRAPPVAFPTRPGQSRDRQALTREAFRLECLTIGWITANRLLLAAIPALAVAGAALAQETDSDAASTGEQGFRRFASLRQDQKAACDAAFRFGALVGADAATRCASPTTVSLASRKR